MPPDVDETPSPGEAPGEYVRRLAIAKCRAVGAAVDDLVIAADTTVTVDGDILGKPADRDEAARMLRRLSGRWHQALTGVALRRGGRSVEEVVVTDVRLAALTADDIAWYVGTGEPFDKAGGYALQGRAAALVTDVEGSVSNVVGLPLDTVLRSAAALGVALLGGARPAGPAPDPGP